MFIIGDIAGQYNALCRLVQRVPNDEEIICVGDLIDRGPHSPEVVSHCIKNRYTCIMGNHENMMVDYYEETRKYDSGTWQYNGGDETIKAYHNNNINPMPYVEWMKRLPSYIIRDNYFISHAPLPSNMTLDDPDVYDELMWNRDSPGNVIKGYPGYKQIFGHNSHWGLKRFRSNATEDMKFYALCIDTSQRNILTAYCTTNNMIYQEPYDPTIKSWKEKILEDMFV